MNSYQFIILLVFTFFIKLQIEIYLMQSKGQDESTDKFLFTIYKVTNLIDLPQLLIIPYVLKRFCVDELLISTIIVSIFGFYRLNFPINGFLSFNLYSDVNRNIYGQENGLSHLSKLLEYSNETLQRCQYNKGPQCTKFTGLQVIVLSGGPGTGKSFVAFKINKHYSAHHLVPYIIPEITPLSEQILNETKKTILKLYSGFSLVIIDSIKPDNYYIQTYLKQLSLFTERHKLDVILILVVKTINVLSYNDIIGVDSFQNKIEYNGYIQLLINDFVNEVLRPISNINYNVVLLEALSINDVKKCMEVNDKSGMSIKYKWNSVLQSSRDRDFVLSGCKAVV